MWLVTALLSATLAACGGGGGDGGSTAAAAPAAPAGAASSGSGNGSSSGGLVGVAAAKGATTLSWQPPTRNDDGTPAKLTGYRIYWGVTEGNYPNSVTLNNPGLTRYVVEQLPPATYYFIATALSADGESEPSNVIAMKVL
jgi:hypothetical protein